jgi:hypothetical protein
VTGARDRLAFGQRVILTAGLAAGLAVIGGYLTTVGIPATGRMTFSGAFFSSSPAYSSSVTLVSAPASLPGWAVLLVWVALAGLWLAAALFLLSGARPASGPVSGFRVAAVIGLAAALSAGSTRIPALASQEAVWLAGGTGQGRVLFVSYSLPGWAVLLILLAVIAAWSAAAVFLTRGRPAPADPAPEA